MSIVPVLVNVILAWPCAYRWWYLWDETRPTERRRFVESIQRLHGQNHWCHSWAETQFHTDLSGSYRWNATPTVRTRKLSYSFSVLSQLYYSNRHFVKYIHWLSGQIDIILGTFNPQPDTYIWCHDTDSFYVLVLLCPKWEGSTKVQ